MLDRSSLSSIIEQLKISKLKKGGKVLTDGGTTTSIEKYILGFKPEALLEIPELIPLLSQGWKVKDIKEGLVEELLDHCRETTKSVESSAEWLKPEDFFPVHDVATNDIIIFNKSGGIAKMAPEVYAKRVNTAFIEIYNNSPLAYVEYCPQTIEVTFYRQEERSEKNLFIANSYVAPNWRIEGDADAKMAPVIKKYFDHLFPIEEEKLAVFHWLHWALKDRVQTILCIPGIQGIGKTLFGEDIISALFGRPNWNKAPRSFTSKEFNKFLKDRRVVLVEEIPTPKSKEDRISINEMLKDITNDTVAIEGKGVDSETVKNHANLVVTSNKLRAIPLDSPIDRRFMCVSTAKVKLDTILTNAEYEELKRIFSTDSEELAQFASWLSKHGRIGDHNAHYNLKNDIKYQIYRMSLSRWEITILKFIDLNKNKGGVFKEEEFEKAVKKDRVKISTIEEFLDSFQMPSGNVIGHWDDRSGCFVLTGEAMSNPVYVSPRAIQHEIYGDAPPSEGVSADEEFFMEYGITREEFEKAKVAKTEKVTTSKARTKGSAL